MKGAAIVRLSRATTALFVVTAVAATFVRAAVPAAVIVDAVLFLGGIVVFGVALVLAAGRSREAEIGIGGLFFLAGSATAEERRAVLAPVVLQVVVALATAAARPFSSLAFGILVPTLGLALAGVWGARHGQFGPRVIDPRRRAR